MCVVNNSVREFVTDAKFFVGFGQRRYIVIVVFSLYDVYKKTLKPTGNL